MWYVVTDAIFARIPEDRHRDVISILENSKMSALQKKALIAGQGVPRSIMDDLEILLEPRELLLFFFWGGRCLPVYINLSALTNYWLCLP